MDKDFIIRKALKEDAGAINEVLVKAFAQYKYFYSQEAYEDTVLSGHKANERINKMFVYVAEDQNKKIIGTIGWEQIDENEGHIRGMAVIPENQGKSSPAKELLKRVEEEAKSKGCSLLTLDTTEVLKRAHKFYEKNGFSLTGNKGNFYGAEIIEYAKEI